MSRRRLRAALATLLPGAAATELLSAMLLEGEAAREAWQLWCSRAGAVKAALGADSVMARPLLALLYDSVRRNEIPVDAETATYLRSAFLTESLRTRTYFEILNEVHAGLASVPYLLIKGAAVAQLYYEDRTLRHAHDIELLTTEREAAAAALSAKGFRAAGRDLVHRSGLPLRIHTELFSPSFRFGNDAAWRHTPSLSPGVRSLDPAHALALTLVQASRSPSRHSGRWACDAAAIVRNGSPEWRTFTETVVAAGAAIPVRLQLEWLRDAISLPIPAAVIEELTTVPSSSAEERAVVRGLELGEVPLWRRVARRMRLRRFATTE